MKKKQYSLFPLLLLLGAFSLILFGCSKPDPEPVVEQDMDHCLEERTQLQSAKAELEAEKAQCVLKLEAKAPKLTPFEAKLKKKTEVPCHEALLTVSRIDRKQKRAYLLIEEGPVASSADLYWAGFKHIQRLAYLNEDTELVLKGCDKKGCEFECRSRGK